MTRWTEASHLLEGTPACRQWNIIWPLLESRWPQPLFKNPNSSACIRIEPLHSINPDMDIQSTGRYQTFQSHPTTEGKSAIDVYLPNCKLAGRLSLSRTHALRDAYQANRGKASNPKEIIET